MQVCENVECAAAWQVSGGASRMVSRRLPATVSRERRAVEVGAVAGRSLALSATIAWIAVNVALAFVPWSALAWIFIAD